jgi:Flp pilus assembly protein TadG
MTADAHTHPTRRPKLRAVLGALRILRDDEHGVVMLETVLVFPLQLMLTMVIIQLAHMYVAANVLQYASFQGTRTYALHLAEGHEAATERGNRAAWTIASTLNNTGGGNGRARMTGYQYRFPDYDSFGRDQMAMAFRVAADDRNAAETIVYGEMGCWLDLTVPVGGPVVYSVLGDEKRSTRSSPAGSIGRSLMHQNSRIPKTWPR